jgi:hypothetical protein
MSEDQFEEESPARQAAPDPAVTPELFREWRSPRFGRTNPERMNNPVWEWLVKSRIDAFNANEKLDGPDSLEAGPCWCFYRYGQTKTQLADGRTVLIAGEHEDSYDADFYIYNDVVVRYPDGRMDILGYPREVFPPTDFHTATLVGNRIVLIGSLGYPEDRRPGTTQVIILELETFKIREIQPSGTPPGWLHAHSATLSEDGESILVHAGKLASGENKSPVENIDDWCLHLADWRWERLAERRWQRWEVRRADKRRNHLWELRQILWAQELPEAADFLKFRQRAEEDLSSMGLKSGTQPDLEIVASLYRPKVDHEAISSQEDEHGVYRVKINGVIVRYVENTWCIQMTVEGELPQATIDDLAVDLRKKLSALENAPCELERL